VRTNLFIPSRFWTTYTNFDNCYLRYIATCGKIILVHIYILGPKLLQWNFLQISQLSIRSGAHKLFRRFFGLFAIFDRNFAKIVALSSEKNENYVVYLKEQSILKMRCKPHQNRPINRHTILV